jgi:hypothetical protein
MPSVVADRQDCTTDCVIFSTPSHSMTRGSVELGRPLAVACLLAWLLCCCGLVCLRTHKVSVAGKTCGPWYGRGLAEGAASGGPV